MDSKKTIISKISNIIFFTFSTFSLIFIWCNYYLRNMTQSLLVTTIILTSITLVLSPILKYKSNKKKNLISSKNQEDYLKMQLLLGNNAQLLKYIIDLFEITKYTIHSDTHISTEKEDIFIYFYANEIENKSIMEFYKQATTKVIKIYCINTPKIYPKIQNLETLFIDFKEIHKTSKTKNKFYDKGLKLNNSTKISLKTFLCVVLCKNRSKSYLYLGLIILFSSLFTPYNLYYIITATVLFLLSIFARFNNIYN